MVNGRCLGQRGFFLTLCRHSNRCPLAGSETVNEMRIDILKFDSAAQGQAGICTAWCGRHAFGQVAFKQAAIQQVPFKQAAAYRMGLNAQGLSVVGHHREPSMKINSVGHMPKMRPAAPGDPGG